jgi:hypothetical protein
MNKRETFTFGTLPTFEDFSTRFDEMCNETFQFTNDKYVGTCKLNVYELWEQLQIMHADWSETCNDEVGSWCSSVLGCLGIEWI